MYGNIEKVSLGYKIRSFNNIFCEISQFFVVYKVEGLYLGGVYFEMIG